MATFRSSHLGATLAKKISSPLPRDKADTLLLLTACTLVLAPHTTHLPLWISLTFPLVLIWRGWITFQGKRMPPRWLLLPASALTMVGVYWTYKTFFGRDAGVAILVLLLSFKLLEMRAKRDLFVIVFLSFFLILTNFFYSQSIGTALMMMIAIIATLTAQLSFQYTGAVPPFKQRLRLGAMIFALALPLTLVFFFLFPRIQGPIWGMPDDANTGRSGMSDSMAPGNISRLAMSDDIAFRVKFIDPQPEKSKLYWRGVVLGTYDGRTWKQLHTSRNPRQITLHARGTPVRHQVTLEPNGRRWIFALELPFASPILNGAASTVTHDLQFLSAAPINDRIRYDATSYTDFDIQADESPIHLQDWLQLPPEHNPRAHAFAKEVRAKSTDEIVMINTVLKFFREENFSYTLEPPLLGKNSVDEFLFATRAGFCEHYASAFVVLMRALDIPARVVTGYQGGEINTVDGFMTVRQSDAHAWAEVWLEKRGWIRVDPTAAVAPNRIEMNLTSVIPRQTFGGMLNLNIAKDSWLIKLHANWDAVNNSWNQWVLNYTPAKQKNLLQSLGFGDVDWRTLTILMCTLGAIAIAITTLPLVIYRRKIDPLDKLYEVFCTQMAKHGCERAMHEGPQAYYARLSSTLPLQMQSNAKQFLQIYTSLRYSKLDHNAWAAAFTKLKTLAVLNR